MSPSVTSPDARRRKPKPASAADRHDPLAHALLPPPNETPTEKQARLLQEKHAKQRSDEIDRLLKQQHDDAHAALPASLAAAPGSSKKGRVYKMVLLGQAGAGKTTVLKQMRLLYDPQAHERERRGWVCIVLLNLTASVRVLLETLALYHDQRLERKSGEMARLERSASGAGLVSTKRDEGAEGGPRNALEVGSQDEVSASSTTWSAHLPAVVQMEKRLRTELGAFGEEVVLPGTSGSAATTRSSQGNDASVKSSDRSPLLLRPGWQERLFTYARRSFSITTTQAGRATNRPDSNAALDDDDDEEENRDTLQLLRAIQADVLAVWNDDARCRALRKRGMFLDGQSDAATSYFLDNYTRLTARAYSPTDDDILHSRVRTLGVTQDVFRVDRSLLYRIYDVGGSRSQRTAWAPFLDDVESIIFLAPLSAFDQPLVEDPATNRLADTFTLFNQIVSNPLLQHATMILFLNKIDLLEKKLRQGVRLQRYWPEYGGDNDFEAVWRWFRAKFRDCLRRAEDELGAGERRRRLYVHTTVATSTVQIRAILMSVKDSILRENLKVTGLVG
ncbi:probable guanine nucleotide-binding protein alpha-4 subunit [Sporisorium reilianum SRZ2]|uniref:Probable guanine nucleotide-binding protein alpha-4 subunit n=1 Tax=Sporisorium reilianum (strain SRZ2) TaxID=999809 RepID=E6ZSG0_SPORE|nr:probable guanine nucleotide-binding protein alpha-4 subunit [Sporisorium reilianum SRZ2]